MRLQNIKTFFPEKQNWKPFFKISLPILFQSIVFNLNLVLDVFLIGDLKGAAEGLRPFIAWNAIIFGIIVGVSITGGVLHTQYYAAGNIQKAKEVNRLRVLISLILGFSFFAVFQSIPDQMLSVFIERSNANAKLAFEQYSRVASVTYLFIAITTCLNAAMREIGRPKYGLYINTTGVVIHAILSLTLARLTSLAIYGAAIGILVSRAIETVLFTIAIHKYGNNIGFAPFSIFKISGQVLKQFFSRSLMFILIGASWCVVIMRDVFYNKAYPDIAHYPNGDAISVSAVLSIISSIQTLFFGVFDSSAGTCEVFVGQELGRGNVDKAKSMSRQLMGFNGLIAVALSILLFAFTFAVPYITIFTDATIAADQKHLILENAKHGLWTLALFYPTWVCYFIMLNSIRSGGKVRLVTIVDSGNGALQLLYLGILIWTSANNLSFPIFYLIFFLSDLLKEAAMIILYFKMDWAKNITHEYEHNKDLKHK